MKVILLEDIESVGKAGDIVDVADGFARNVLFPNGRAAAATANRVKEVAETKARREKQSEEELQSVQQIVERLDQKTVTLTVPAGPEGKLHGAVTAADVAQALNRTFGATVPVVAVRLPAPIREPGEQKVSLEFSHGLEAEVTVVVTGGTPPTTGAS